MFLVVSALIAGVASILIGLADIAVALRMRRVRKTRDLLVDGVFLLLGILILGLLWRWVGGQASIDLGPVLNPISGTLLLLVGVGAFALRAVIDVRDGQRRLQEGHLTGFSRWRSLAKSIAGIIMLVFIVFALLMLFLSSRR